MKTLTFKRWMPWFVTGLGWMLLSGTAGASAFGVSLSSSGAAGDACASQPYIGNEAFNSGALTGSNSVSYSGSAVGYDNGWPGPVGSNMSGCQYSPVFANVGASGVAALGILRATASAEMDTVGLIQAGSIIDESWNDTFTAVSGGTYDFFFGLNAIDTASPRCPGGNPLTQLTYGFGLSAQVGGTFSDAAWSYGDCSASTGPYQTYGNPTVLSPGLVEAIVNASAGSTFTVSASIGLHVGAGFNESSQIDASDTATLDIVPVNGATYITASGTVYNFTDSGAPEPASWLLAGCFLLIGILVRRQLNNREG